MLVVKMLQLTGCNRFFRRSLDTSIFRTDWGVKNWRIELYGHLDQVE
jgi:hypothetical protein